MPSPPTLVLTRQNLKETRFYPGPFCVHWLVAGTPLCATDCKDIPIRVKVNNTGRMCQAQLTFLVRLKGNVKVFKQPVLDLGTIGLVIEGSDMFEQSHF